jgi:hypothetical protein
LQNREYVPVVLDWAVENETCEYAKGNMTSYACKAEYSECYNSTNGTVLGIVAIASLVFRGTRTSFVVAQVIKYLSFGKPFYFIYLFF